MQQKETGGSQSTSDNTTSISNQQMATNPNPRANENLEGTSIDKASKGDSTPDVGSEITDGAAS